MIYSDDNTTRPSNNRYRKKPKKSKGISPLAIFAIFSFIVILCLFGGFLAFKYMPSFENTDIFQVYENLGEDEMNIIMADEVIPLENYPYFESEILYIPVDYIKNYLDPYIFWDEPVQKLTITTENKVIRMKTDELTYYVNDEPMELSMPVYSQNGMAYMPKEMVEKLYNVNIEFKEKYSFVIIDKNEDNKTITTNTKDTKVRADADIKSPVIEEIPEGTNLTIYEEGEKFDKVRTEDGLIGYAYTKDMGESEVVNGITQEEQPIPPTTPPIEDEIVMLWDQSPRKTVGATIPDEVNVLSPTWFSFDDETLNGDIVVSNDASLEYVNWAHENNVQVWALITDNFNSEVSHAILSNTDTREHVIKQILAYTSMYNLDGINIDFEAITVDDAPYFVQFLRELKPLLAEQGVYLSVDLYVPLYTKHYNRTEIAKTVDYICVMAYDEHYSGSPTSGPVASLGFVEDGIVQTLEEVPKEKIILGIPTYVRIWREVEVNGEVTFTIKNLAMEDAYDQFVENGAEFTWLEDIGSYYAEYTTVEDGENVTYKVWLEDERSVSMKLDLAQKYGLSGIAFWKKGLEKSEVWDEVDLYLEESSK